MRSNLPLGILTGLLSVMLILGCGGGGGNASGGGDTGGGGDTAGQSGDGGNTTPDPADTTGDTGTSEDPTPAPTGVADFDAATFYTDNCQRCHGMDGEGKSGPAYSTRLDKDDAVWADAIRNGRTGMPKFKVLSEEQAMELAVWIRANKAS